jgi:MSHA pilin protein MshA
LLKGGPSSPTIVNTSTVTLAIYPGVHFMRKTNQGFTLIELVVVITILGILAAFAIPHFTQLENQARISALTGLSGSLKSASALAHAQYLAVGTAPASVTMEGQTVTLANGYPDAPGIQLAIQDTTGFTAAVVGTTVTYTKTGAVTPASCTVAYTASAAAGSPPVIGAPVTGGC